MGNFFKFSIKNNLLTINVLLIFFLILFFNIGMLPLESSGDFIFFFILIFAFALYRPGWAFLFFTGMVALENITLISRETGLMLRPYQLLGLLILLAIAIRFFVKRLNFSLFKLKWFDAAIVLVGLSGFLSIMGASDKLVSLKLSIIIISFIFLYFLTRIFIQDTEDASRILPFVLGSAFIVAAYGIWQNIRFIHGSDSFEVMPGRPNGTFTEADWLGLFLVLIICIVYAMLYKKQNDQEVIIEKKSNFKIKVPDLFFTLCFLFLITIFVLIIITVSRSAWLGVGAATIFFLLANLLCGWKIFWRQVTFIFFAVATSLLAIGVFHLTDFQLFNRAQSTTSGLQKITIACQKNINLPEKIKDVSELEAYGCQHINLEEIESEKEKNRLVKEIYRSDPNVSIRSEIYQKSWEQIKKHPIMGIGWGNINNILGRDERGVGLNSSNIFLEIWLGSGILGLVAFLSVWIYILFKSIRDFFETDNALIKAFFLFVVISWFGLTITNFFNAGIMLGFFWVYIAVSLIDCKKDESRY